jgi:hypothetical protein
MAAERKRPLKARFDALMDEVSGAMATSLGSLVHWVGWGLLTTFFLAVGSGRDGLLPPPAEALPAIIADGGPLEHGRTIAAVPADVALLKPEAASLELDGKRYHIDIVGASREEMWLAVGDRKLVVPQTITIGPPGPAAERAWGMEAALVVAIVLALAWLMFATLESRVTEGRWGVGALDLSRAISSIGLLLSVVGFFGFLIFDVRAGPVWALLPFGWVFGMTFSHFERHDAFTAAIDELKRPLDVDLAAAVSGSRRWLLSLEDWDLLARLDREKGDIVRQLMIVGIRPVPQPNTLAATWGPLGHGSREEDKAEWAHHLEHNERVVERLRLCLDLGLLVLVANRLQTTLLAREQLALPTMLLLPRIPPHARAQLARATADLQRGDARSAASLCGGIVEGLAKHVVKRSLASNPPTSHKALQKAMDEHGIKWSTLEAAPLGTLALVLARVFSSDASKLPLSDFGEQARKNPRLELGRTLVAVANAATPVRNAFAHERNSMDQRSEPVLAFRLLQLTRVFAEIVAELLPDEDPPAAELVESHPVDAAPAQAISHLAKTPQEARTGP